MVQHFFIGTPSPRTGCRRIMAGLASRIGYGRTCHKRIRSHMTGRAILDIMRLRRCNSNRCKPRIVHVAFRAVSPVIVRLAAGRRAHRLMMVGLCMAGVAEIVFRGHIFRFIPVIGKAVGTGGRLEGHIVSANHAPYKDQVRSVSKVDLLPHGVMAFHTVERSQLTGSRIVIGITEVRNHLDIRTAPVFFRRPDTMAAFTGGVGDRGILHKRIAGTMANRAVECGMGGGRRGQIR